MKFKTPYNAKEFPQKQEINRLPSMTSPDQAMSVKTILERYARGLAPSNLKTPIFEGEDADLPDLSNMDLADREAYIEQYYQELNELREKEARYKKYYQEKQQEAEAQKKQKYRDQELPFEEVKPVNQDNKKNIS